VKEFNYSLNYKTLDFTDSSTRKLYRIGRGEQGVLLVRPYTENICQYWRFKNETTARKSALKIYQMFLDYSRESDFIGMDMARKFLEMGFTRARRYANHSSGQKYSQTGEVLPQDKDALTCEKAKSATIFKHFRDLAAKDLKYVRMRKNWRAAE
jgi:hypothetical protein